MSQNPEIKAVFAGVDEMTPVINKINGGLTNTARVSQNASHQMSGMGGMLSRQWEKFSKTFNYAFSGTAVYKVYQAYQNLVEYNQALGNINAMIPNVGKGLNDLGDIAINVSNRTGQPLQDVLGSIQNIIQSIPNMSAAARQHLVPAMAEIEASASKITQIDPRSFGSSVLAIATSFYGRNAVGGKGGAALLNRVANMLVETQYTTPRLSGSDLTTYLPRMAGFATASGFNLPQMLSLFTVAQRAMGSASTASQYVRQLMIRLNKPTPQESPYYEQAGLNPKNLPSNGMQVLNTLIRHGLSLPGGATPAQLQAAMSTGNYNQINVKGQALQFFRNAIGGRQQSQVAMTAIVRNLGQVALQEKMLADNTDIINKGMAAYNRQNSLQLFSNAVSNTTTELLHSMMPAVGPAATALTKMATGATTVLEDMNKFDYRIGAWIEKHLGASPTTVSNNNFAAGGLNIATLLGGGMALNTLFKGREGGSLATRILKRVPGLRGRIGAGNAITALANAETPAAAASALANQANGTPSAPFWVVIHPLSKNTVPGLFGNTKNGPGGITKDVEDAAKGGGAIAAVRAALSRAGVRAGLGAGAATALAPELPAVGDAIKSLRGGDPFGRKDRENVQQMIKQGFNPTVAKYFRSTTGKSINNSGLVPRKGTPAWMTALLKSNLAESHGLFSFIFGGQFNEGKFQNNLNDILSGKERNPFIKHANKQIQRHVQTATKRHVAQIGKMTEKTSWIPQVNIVPNGKIDAEFTLTPTAELKNLIEPQTVRAKVPVQMWDKSPSPPSERGKRKVTRNRGNK